MIGSIIGDIAGSRFRAGGSVPEDAELLAPGCTLTDGVLLTMSAAKAITECEDQAQELPDQAAFWLNEILSQYAEEDATAGGRDFACSIAGPCGLAAGSKEEAGSFARSIMSARLEDEEDADLAADLAGMVALAASGMSKEEIEQLFSSRSYTMAELLASRMDEATRNRLRNDTAACCLAAFLDGADFEDTVRKALVYSHGDPAVAAGAGAIGEAFFGVPEEIEDEAVTYLNPDFQDIIQEFDEYVLTLRVDS
ncbi:MAG: hypothetical protein HDQ87_08600 [Clostridia bacterium]|nr:hypothetical protein [Clostridia bacterium]